MRAISFGNAIREAMDQEMERDERVFVYGIGVPNHAKIFGTTDGLVEKYGPTRCFDTPIAEECMTGFGLGAAVKGLRPIHIHIRPDFLLVGMNQLVNMVSNYCYTTDGKVGVPMVIRAIIGRGWGQGYQHSKSLFSYFTHIPGLKVVAPTTPSDAKGLLISAIRDDNPVIFLEHRWLYWATEAVPEEPYAIEFGTGRTLRAGADITVIGISWMNVEALRAADIIQRHGVNIEVIDPRTLVPLDEDLLVASVEKTGYCIVADCDWLESGVSAEIAARVSYRCFGKLKAPVERIGFAPTPCPTVRELEDDFYPHAGTIVRAVGAMLKLDAIDLSAEDFYSHEHRFKGPF